MDYLTELCYIAQKYGTDKCPQVKHHYTPFYYSLFVGKRDVVRKVVEFGIGYCKYGKDAGQPTFDRRLKRLYHRGASLLMWRDFFPNATIYGVDIAPEAMFEADRIRTYLCNEQDVAGVRKVMGEIGDADIVIDDASHRMDDQVLLARTVVPLLSKTADYIIEDVQYPVRIAQVLQDEFVVESPELIARWYKERLLVVKQK